MAHLIPHRRKRISISHGFILIHLHEGELLMMTIRSHDQFNTTIYGLNDRYRGVYNERRVILMNQGDMNQRNLKQGDVVDIFNHHGGVERVAHKFIAECPILFHRHVRLLIFLKPMYWCR